MGKGSSQTIGYKYYLGMQQVLSHGPIDYISRIQVDLRTAWTGRAADTRINVAAEDLFGGEKREGGISGPVDIEMGYPTQLQNSYLVAQCGADVPAYRGVCQAVLRQCYVGNNPYLKAWSFRGKRIHVRQDGIAQWYDATAEIGLNPLIVDSVVNVGPVNFQFTLPNDNLRNGDLLIAVGWSYPFAPGAVTAGWTLEPSIANNPHVSDPGIRVAYKFLGTGESATQTPFTDPGLSDCGVNVIHLRGPTSWAEAFQGFTYARTLFGASSISAGYTAMDDDTVVFAAGFYHVASGTPPTPTITGSDWTVFGTDTDWELSGLSAYIDGLENGTSVSATYNSLFGGTISSPNILLLGLTGTVIGGNDLTNAPDMNPIHVIREALTDPDWGMGYQESDVDETSFRAAADTIFNEELGVSFLWDKQTTIEDFVSEVIKHIDAALYVSRTTGKFVIKLIRNDYDVGSLLSLDESNIVKVQNPHRPGFGDLCNAVTVNFWNSTTGTDDSLSVIDPALVQMQGQPIMTTLQYPGFTKGRNASITAARDLRSLSVPFLSCTIYADETARSLNIGDPFKFSWARWQVSDMVMRVTGIAFGDGKSNQVRITCSQDVFQTPITAVVTAPGGDNGGGAWTDPSAPPTAISSGQQLGVEAPYYEAVQRFGQVAVDSNLTATPETGYIITAASRPGAAINAEVWADDGSGYTDVGTLDFCPTGALAADITKLATSFTISGGKELDQVAVGTHMQVGNELMRVDTLDTSTGAITVGRGVLDTVPETHLASDRVFFWDALNGIDGTQYVLGETVNVKIRPITGSGVLALAAATAIPVVMQQRAYRPYPPGQFKIDGAYYPSGTFEGAIAVTWAHRDRTQETSGTLYDHTHADIGPETGTTYRLQGYVDGVLVHTEEPISGTSTTWTPDDGGFVTIEVHSKRDGVYSLFAPSHEILYTATGARVTEGDELRVTEEGDILRTMEE